MKQFRKDMRQWEAIQGDVPSDVDDYLELESGDRQHVHPLVNAIKAAGFTQDPVLDKREHIPTTELLEPYTHPYNPRIKVGCNYRLELQSSTDLFCPRCGGDMGGPPDDSNGFDMGFVEVVSPARGRLECPNCFKGYVRIPPEWYMIDKMVDGSPWRVAVPGEWLQVAT